MANEILKDEILKEEQLDGVAGGITHEIKRDAEFMKAVGLLRQDEGTNNDLRKVWAQEGITVVLHGGKEFANEYYKGGRQITREQAMKVVMRNTGTNLNINNYV